MMIKYDPAKYENMEGSAEAGIRLRNLRSHNLEDLRMLKEKVVGNRLEFSYEYGFGFRDLENILRVHMPEGADSFSYWGTRKGNLRVVFYKINNTKHFD